MPPRFLGRQKAAALLIALGPDLSSQVLKHCRDDEIERITLEIFNMQQVGAQQRDDIIEECYELALADTYISEGGVDYARDLLARTMGRQKAEDVISRLTATLQVNPFDFLRTSDPSQVIGFIQNEHPQTIALILAHLTPSQSSNLLASLDSELQAEVSMRIAVMDRTTPEVVKEVEKVLKKKLSSVLTQGFSSAGGLEYLVKVLNQVDRGTEKGILEVLGQRDEELAEQIRKLMFVFEDVVKLDDRSIQRVLREVDNKDLVLALKGSSQEVQNRIFNNMSGRAAAMLKEDMAVMGPVRVRTAEEAQQRIVNVIRRLDESEEIVISRGAEADVIV